MSLILASASPRRQELLQRIVPNFVIEPADLDESTAEVLPARQRPVFLAREKAILISRRHPTQPVLGCDTGVLLDDQMLGKPADYKEACAMLKALSGRTHEVVTGCCLVQNGLTWCFSTVTRVTFYPLSSQQIVRYAATSEPYDKAGGYGIQGAGAVFVRSIAGDYYNVVGLPVSVLARVLRQRRS